MSQLSAHWFLLVVVSVCYLKWGAVHCVCMWFSQETRGICVQHRLKILHKHLIYMYFTKGRNKMRLPGSSWFIVTELLFYCHGTQASCRLRGCKNRPAPFPGRISYKATKPGFSLSHLSMFLIVLLIRAPLYVLFVFVDMCSVFWLFWLHCQYLPIDWLERLLWGSLTVMRGSSPYSPGKRAFMDGFLVLLFNCILCLSCPPALRDILHTPMAR